MIHPFAFKVHTHHLGVAVSGYKVTQEGEWQLIGKHDPRELNVRIDNQKSFENNFFIIFNHSDVFPC